MLGAVRRDAILRSLSQQGSIKVSALSRLLHCSEATLRRDLHHLEELGLLRRTYGGALLRAEATVPERTLRDRAMLCVEEKTAIAAAAARLVSDGDVIGLNGGTTTLHVARAIRYMGALRVVTNSLGAANELVDQPGMEVTVLGGRLRSTLEMSGPQPELLLEGIFLNTAFIGVDGLTAKHGLTTYNQLEAHTSLAIIRRAERVVVVADHTKIGRLTMALIAPVSAAHILITDTGSPERRLAPFRDAGLEVVVAS